MRNAFGRWIDLSGMSFADGESTWLQALPLGTYDHPVFGTIQITPDRVQRFAQNVRERVRDQDLDIDYDHKLSTQVAAGWVGDAQARPDGLWIRVDWTPTARQKLKDKEYRYFSPEFADEWQHPKTGIVHKDVLFGGALTNRPFLKDILPINLSEMVGETMGDTKTGGGGTPPTDAENLTGLAKLLGLSGQVTSADLLSAATTKLSDNSGQNNTGNQNTTPPQNFQLNVPAPQPSAGQQFQLQLVPAGGGGASTSAPSSQGTTGGSPTPLPNAAGGGGTGAPQGAQGFGNLLQPIKLDDKLAGDPVALADVVRAQNEKIGLLASAHKLAEAQALIMGLSEGNGAIGLSPVVRDLAIELIVKAPTALSETVEKLLRAVAEGKATVALGELGRARSGAGSVVKQFTDAIARLRKEDDKLSYADAVDRISRSDPRLAQQYLAATAAGEE